VAGRTPLLLIDEAQQLRNSARPDRDMLGMIKTLTNMMLENERLIQIILFGQLELIPLLKARRELMSRVAQFGVLSPLVKGDAVAIVMIASKLPKMIGIKIPTLDTTATWNEDELVTPNRCRGAVHVRSGGAFHDQRYASQGDLNQRDSPPNRA
jgi:hypothetical protein